MLIAHEPSILSPDPVKNALETIVTTCSSAQLPNWGLLTRDGVFYATVPMHGQALPFEVALHGVRSESEAQQAIALFARGDVQQTIFTS